MNILVVDDDRIIVRGLINIINRMGLDGVKIMAAYNAIDALEILKHEGQDLLITDVEMPVMNGLELISEAGRRSYNGKVIILSGFDSFEFARQAMRFRVSDYLLKPIDKTELQNLITGFYGELHKKPEQSGVSSLPGLDIYGVEPKEEDVPKRFAEMLRFMRANYLYNLSLEKLGDRFGLHPNYLCGLFRSSMNMTFHHYLDCLRLRKGVMLLLNNSDMPVAEISGLCGFTNERQFYTVFKKRIGNTPGAFRKEHEGVRIKVVSIENNR